MPLNPSKNLLVFFNGGFNYDRTINKKFEKVLWSKFNI